MQLSDLKPAPYNPRVIDDANRAGLAYSLDEFGDLSGITWNKRTGHIVCGHQRIRELTDMSATFVGDPDEPQFLHGGDVFPVRIVDWPLGKEKAANMAANSQQIAGVFDGTALQVLGDIKEAIGDQDFTGLRFDSLIDDLNPNKVPIVIQDDVPEPPKNPVTRVGDIWTLGRHRVLCGDSATQLVCDNADLLLTDPPYNVGSETKLMAKTASKSIASLADAEWDREFDLRPCLKRQVESLARNCSAYVFTSQFLAGMVWEWMSGWAKFHSWCVWDKSNPMPSLSGRHWTWSGELVCYATRGRHVFNKQAGHHAPNVWRVAKGKETDHPTEKPVALIAIPMGASSNPGQLVLDPFLGSGTTLIAAEQLDRISCGIELDPRYVDLIVERWQNLTGGKATREKA